MNFFSIITLIGTTLMGLTAKSLYDIQKLENELSTARLDIVKLQADNELLKQHNSIITDYIKMNNETLNSINTTVHNTPDLVQSNGLLSVIFFGAIAGMALYIYLYGATSEQVDSIVMNHVNKLTTDVASLSDKIVETTSQNIIENSHFQEKLTVEIMKHQGEGLQNIMDINIRFNRQIVDMLKQISANVKGEELSIDPTLMEMWATQLATGTFVPIVSTLT